MIAPMRKAKAKRSAQVTRSVILNHETDSELLKIAEREERPLTWIMAKAIKEFLERDRQQHAPK